jgi:NAD+ synthase
MLTMKPGTIPALVVVDMQNFFFQKPERRHGLELVIEKINQLSTAFDMCGWPVIHAVTAFHADGRDWDLKMHARGVAELIEGSQEAHIIPGIRVQENHLQVVKTRYSAFFKTGLAEKLTDLRVGKVMVAGAYTHYCVNATVFDAYAHDFVPGLISDAVISHLPDESELIITRMRRNDYHVLSTAEFLAGMEN